MYLVCEKLKINRLEIISDLIETIEAVASISLTGTNINALKIKAEGVKKKRIGLIELYTSGDIDRSKFTAMRAKYDEEIEKQQEMTEKQQKMPDDIKKAVEELVNDVRYEDDFYTQLPDKMVMNGRDHVDVYLNMLPYKWQFAIAKSVKGAMEALKKGASDGFASEPSVSYPSRFRHGSYAIEIRLKYGQNAVKRDIKDFPFAP